MTGSVAMVIYGDKAFQMVFCWTKKECGLSSKLI